MTWQVNVTIPYFSAIPEDVIVNTWHFVYGPGGPTDTNYGELTLDIAQFYLDTYSAIGAGLTWAPWVRPDQATMKVYDLTDPTPRAPVYEVARDLSASTSSSSTITPETAICLSFQADKLSGVSQSSRRGRVYLGGLGVGQTAGSASLFPQLSSAIRTGIATNASALLSDTLGHDWTWIVWSRLLGTGAAVTNGWVDNAMDTQRRRGQTATARTTWT